MKILISILIYFCSILNVYTQTVQDSVFRRFYYEVGVSNVSMLLLIIPFSFGPDIHIGSEYKFRSSNGVSLILDAGKTYFPFSGEDNTPFCMSLFCRQASVLYNFRTLHIDEDNDYYPVFGISTFFTGRDLRSISGITYNAVAGIEMPDIFNKPRINLALRINLAIFYRNFENGESFIGPYDAGSFLFATIKYKIGKQGKYK